MPELFLPSESDAILIVVALGRRTRLLVLVCLFSTVIFGQAQDRSFHVISMNDVYRIAGLELADSGGPARVRALRASIETETGKPVLLLHAGDFVEPSFLSRIYFGEQMVDILNRMDGDPQALDPYMFVTFGNHEFDLVHAEGAHRLQERIDESQFLWLGSNIDFAPFHPAVPTIISDKVIDHALVDMEGVQVGVFGLTIPSEHPSYIHQFEDPVETAREATRVLRGQGAEVVIALTHQLMETDLKVLRSLGAEGPDVILGGHVHVSMAQRAGGRWVYKADEDAQTVNLLKISLPESGGLSIDRDLVALEGDDPAPDPDVWARIQEWEKKFDTIFCHQRGELPGCLDLVLGKTATDLSATELAVRREETSAGNWVADVLRSVYDGTAPPDELQAEDPPEEVELPEADVAVINAGTLRLNQEIPGGSPLTRREVEELIGYPTTPVLVKITGATLKKLLREGAKHWPGNGNFLHVSGLAYRHEPAAGTVSDVTLVTPEESRPVADDDVIHLATIEYLVKESPEFSPLFNEAELLHTSLKRLKPFLIEAIRQAGEEGIHPRVEGRICQDDDGPCLAVPARTGRRVTSPAS